MRARRILLTILLLLLLLPSTAYAKYSKPYYIRVDLSSQIVTVYHTATDTIAQQMICSTGVQETTPRGTYYLPKPEAGEREPWYYFSLYDCYTQYVTRIIDNVMFHSIPCSYKSQKSVSETAMSKLGTPAFHGCIRLLWPDAKFIAEECAPGTRVEIYKSRKEYEELKVLLLAESYDGSRPYREYCALTDTPGALGMGSRGDAVRDLQSRLRDLGIFNGEITGAYRADTVEQNGERLQAVIKPRYGEKAQIYDADSDDGEIIGHMKAGLYVAVLENTESGWSHVTYQGHEGFMRDEDLVFLNGVV